MSATLPPSIKFQPLVAGVPLPGGKVYFYAAGTTTPQSVFADDGVTPLTNPLILDANGAGSFRLGSSLAYKINLTDAADVQIAGWPVDALADSAGVLQALLAGTTATTGAASVGFDPSLNYPANTVGKYLHDQVAGVSTNVNPSVVAAPGAPNTAIGAAGALTGTYTHGVSFYTTTGETEVGAESSPVTVTAQNINLTAIPTSSSPLVIGRKVYRTYTGGADVVLKKLVATIADNTTTTYTDSVADGSLGVACPRINTTGANSYIGGVRNFYDGPGTCAAFGSNTMPNNTGYANSAFGPNALTANTTGYRNCAFGIFSLYLNTTGARNTAYGIHTLNNNTTHNDSTAFGYAALINADADGNSAFGASALETNVSGAWNAAFGFRALQMNTGSSGAAFGYYALQSNTTGSFNSGFGYYAGANCTTGNFNSSFGTSAGRSNVTASGNTAFGALALTAATAGDNSAFGNQAGQAITTGTTNTTFGSGSLQACVSGSGNVCFGYQAGYWETGSNKLFIDNQARASEADARLKALVYGIFDAAIANQSVQINGKFGVNGSTPPAKPAVTGSRGGNAALASLLTALASYGFITDSTTA